MSRWMLAVTFFGLVSASEFPLISECHAAGPDQDAQAQAGQTGSAINPGETVSQRSSEKTALDVPELMAQLRDPATAQQAAFGLGRLGPRAKQAIPALLELLESEDSELQIAALNAIRSIGPEAEQALPSIKNLLAKREQLSQEAIKLLVDLLDKQDQVTIVAIAAIGGMKEEAASAAPSLSPFLKSRDDRVRLATATTLCQIGQEREGCKAALITLLRSDDRSIRAGAIRQLARFFKNDAKDSVPEVIQMLKHDPEGRVREAAAGSLVALGGNDPEIILALTGALRDKLKYVQEAASRSLKDVQP